MDASYISLPPEWRDALQAHGGLPLHIWDDENQKAYVLIEEAGFQPIDDEYILRGLQEALEDEARGDVAPLDIEEIKREGHRILARRRSQPSE